MNAMLPPLTTINDAIGLLVALGDSERTKALLEELKGSVATANKMLAEVQAAQRYIDEDKRKRDAERDELGKAKLALAEARNIHAAKMKADSESFAALAIGLQKKEQELAVREGVLDRRESEISAREAATEAKRRSLNEREGKVVDKELRVEELMKIFKPIMDQLR
jgi:DNA repair exonuclease SbcCD ATPase subunit